MMLFLFDKLNKMSAYSYKKSLKTQSTLPLVLTPQQRVIRRFNTSESQKNNQGSRSYDNIYPSKQESYSQFTSNQNKRYARDHKYNGQFGYQRQKRYSINVQKLQRISGVTNNEGINLTKLTQQINEGKQKKIQQIYMAKGKPFRRGRQKNNVHSRKKQTQIQIMSIKQRDQQEELQTISEEVSKNKQFRDFQNHQTLEDYQSETKKQVYKTLTHLKQSSAELKSMTSSHQPTQTILQHTDYTWMKNNYHPHLEVLKQVDRDTLSFYKYANATYYGQFSSQGKKQGLGILFYSNGKLFQGYFKNDIKHGSGYQLHPDGSFYVGQYQNGEKEGKGRYDWSNGQVYDGQWKSGKKHGSGLWQNKNGTSSYIGQWSQGMIEGFGVLISQNGSRFEGQFSKAMKHGKGTLRQSNGQTYIGQFRKNIPNGQGEYYWSNGDYYKGGFSNGMRHGRGTQKFADGSIYKGEFRNDKKSGYGQQMLFDGLKYVGNFENNYRHGYGELFCQNNSVYKGYWVNNKSVEVSDTPVIVEEEAELLESIMGMRSKEKLQELGIKNKKVYEKIIRNYGKNKIKQQKKITDKDQEEKSIERPNKNIRKQFESKSKNSKSSAKQLFKKVEEEHEKDTQSLDKEKKRGCRCRRKH